MTLSRALRALVPLTMAAALAGCANDQPLFGSDLLTTSSITPAVQAAPPPTPRVDPACVALQAKIDGLRQEGTPERVAKVATGKTKTVSIKRASLAKVAELDGANQEFQAKCSTLQPARAQTASTNLPPNVSIVSGPAPGAATAQQVATAAKAATKAATPPVLPATTD